MGSSQRKHFLREVESVASGQDVSAQVPSRCSEPGAVEVWAASRAEAVIFLPPAADQWGQEAVFWPWQSPPYPSPSLALPRASPCAGFCPWPVLPSAAGTPDKPLKECVLLAWTGSSFGHSSPTAPWPCTAVRGPVSSAPASLPPSPCVWTPHLQEVAPGVQSPHVKPPLTELTPRAELSHHSPLPSSWDYFSFCLSFSLLLDDSYLFLCFPITLVGWTWASLASSCGFSASWLAGDRGRSVSAPVLGTVPFQVRWRVRCPVSLP